MAKIGDFIGDRCLEELFTDLGIKDRKAAKQRLLDARKEQPSETARQLSLQEHFNEIEKLLRIALEGALDKPTWMSFSRQQHEDLRYIFEKAAEQVKQRFLQTHPQKKEEA